MGASQLTDGGANASNPSGLVPSNPSDNSHNARTPVNPDADIPMTVGRTDQKASMSSTGFEPRHA